MKRSRRCATYVLVGALVAAAGACSTNADSGSATTTLTVGAIAEPANLDFTSTEGAAIPQALLYNVYEGLVKLDQAGEIVPALATAMPTVSGDRKTYTFKLRPGVKFSNGETFDSADAKFSLERVKTSWKLQIKAAFDIITKVEAPDAQTVVVTLSAPSNSWLYTMTSRLGAMFDQKGVGDLANKPVGTGPYVLDEWRKGDSLTLRRNDSYWGTKPALSSVVLRYFKDAAAMNNALLSNSIDVLSTVQAPDTLSQFADTTKYQVIEGTTTGEVVLSMNNGKGLLTDPRVRKAIRLAIDHQALLNTAWAGRGELIGSFVPPTDPWYEDRTGDYKYNPSQAKELLRQAGVADGTTLRFRIPNLPYAVASAQVVKSQLAQVGLTANIDTLEFPAAWLTQVFTNADYDMSIVAHVEPRDMAIFANPKYYFRYSDPKYQQLLTEADTGSPEQQTAKLKEAAELLSQDAAADFLFLLPNLIVAKNGVTGLPRNQVSEAFDMSALSKS